MVLSSWPKSLRNESSLDSSDECRLSARWPPTLRPSQLTWVVTPPKIGTSTIATVIITQPIRWYSFYHPTEGGRLSRPRHSSKGYSPCPRLYITAAVTINTTVRGGIRTRNQYRPIGVVLVQQAAPSVPAPTSESTHHAAACRCVQCSSACLLYFAEPRTWYDLLRVACPTHTRQSTASYIMKKNIKIKTKIKIAPTTLAQRIPINNQTVTD